MSECIFCDIVHGDAPCRLVKESELALCFVSIDDRPDYHLLVVPKRHVVNILDCDSQSLRAVIELAQSVARHLVGDCEFDGVDLLSTSFAEAQSVPHFHVHLLPRAHGDGLNTWPDLPERAVTLDEVWRRTR
ncbi:hydrolase [Bifidobacterium hapali]|uniref:Hydrolase n=1 Tax=Bifidobacterium hapali TaxID=1630172 RepID=A0A261FX76_9BIFI|nr:HIT family protein [Bifidobacterium hapali]OZG63781.1 hydrolase [Bifidobacterium hapali]